MLKKKEIKKPVVVIVEDDPFLSEMYADKLSREGFEAEVAMDGEEGFNKIKEIKPRVALLDIVLPKMDGFETLKKLKADPETKDVPIILLTNLGQKNEVEKGLALGAADYIVKAHFTPTAVVARIKKALGQMGAKK